VALNPDSTLMRHGSILFGQRILVTNHCPLHSSGKITLLATEQRRLSFSPVIFSEVVGACHQVMLTDVTRAVSKGTAGQNSTESTAQPTGNRTV
jgi:hypothetical protein